MNFAWRREDIPLDYLFIHDVRLQRSEIKIEDGFGKIRDKIFVGRYSKISTVNWLDFSEDFFLDDKKFCPYYLNASGYEQLLHQNICCHGLADFGSVAFAAIHFALFTYPSEIYLVGCDTNRTGHFYDVGADKNVLNTRKIKVGFARIKMFAKQYYPETEIISVNPVGLRGLFKDVYTESYREDGEERKK